MKIVFMGTPQSAVPSLARVLADGHTVAAVYTQPDRPSGRGKKIVFSPVKEFALRNDLPVFQPAKIKSPEAIDTFRSHKADISVVVAYGRILPDKFLNAFPNGAINVHFSLLPKYRGAAPVNWAIVNGEKITGVTTMWMDEGLDTGDILLQKVVEIGPEETSAELMQRLSEIGAYLLSETLSRFQEIVPRKQEHSLATYAPILKKDDGRVDWSMEAAKIALRVRGFQPFPTAFTYFRENRLTLWKAVVVDAALTQRGCGVVTSVEKDGLVIECGHGTFLRLEELQIEGKGRVSARDFVNGMRPIPGEQFR